MSSVTAQAWSIVELRVTAHTCSSSGTLSPPSAHADLPILAFLFLPGQGGVHRTTEELGFGGNCGMGETKSSLFFFHFLCWGAVEGIWNSGWRTRPGSKSMDHEGLIVADYAIDFHARIRRSNWNVYTFSCLVTEKEIRDFWMFSLCMIYGFEDPHQGLLPCCVLGVVSQNPCKWVVPDSHPMSATIARSKIYACTVGNWAVLYIYSYTLASLSKQCYLLLFMKKYNKY